MDPPQIPNLDRRRVVGRAQTTAAKSLEQLIAAAKARGRRSSMAIDPRVVDAKLEAAKRLITKR